MTVYLIIALSVLAVLASILIVWKIKHRKPYRVKDLVKVEEMNESGQLCHVYHHINGVRNGEELFFYSNGKLNKKKHWVADKLEGYSVTFFESGKKYIMANYTNGALNGDYIVHTLKGKVSKAYKYDNGIRVGI